MNPELETKLKALSRTGGQPSFALAYAAVEGGEDEDAARAELRRLVDTEGLLGPDPVVENDHVHVSAAKRPGFRGQILSRLENPSRRKSTKGETDSPITGRKTAERAREVLDAGLLEGASLLEEVRRESAASEPYATASDPSTDSEPDTGPEPRGAVPLVVLRRLSDLGPDAESIAGALSEILRRDGHVLAVADALDTRRREGRFMLRLALELGFRKSEKARALSREKFEERLETLKVYGAIPYGFSVEESRATGILSPDPLQMETVKEILELLSSGWDAQQVAHRLNAGKRRFRDGTPWTARRIRDVGKKRDGVYRLAIGRLRA